MPQNSNLENFRRQLSKHTLELVQEGKITAYYLRGPEGGRMMSTLIVFTPEGIALMGDLTPERNGSVSALGYGVDWFSGELGESYICQKFLTKRFVPDAVRAGIHEWIARREPEEAKPIDEDDLRLIMGSIEDEDWHQVREGLEEIGYDTSDGITGWTYDPIQAAWLCAIQERFSELYHAPVPVTS